MSPKIHKRLFNKPGRPVISNRGTPTQVLLRSPSFWTIMQNADHLDHYAEWAFLHKRLLNFFRKDKNYRKCSLKCNSCHC